MNFNLTALKAYIGGALFSAQEAAQAGHGLAGFLIKGFEATIFNIPDQFEPTIATGIAFAIGYVAVYFTKNKTA